MLYDHVGRDDIEARIRKGKRVAHGTHGVGQTGIGLEVSSDGIRPDEASSTASEALGRNDAKSVMELASRSQVQPVDVSADLEIERRGVMVLVKSDIGNQSGDHSVGGGRHPITNRTAAVLVATVGRLSFIAS